MSFAPQVRDIDTHPSPAASELQRQITPVLSLCLSPRCTAAAFLPRLPEGLPVLAPILVGADPMGGSVEPPPLLDLDTGTVIWRPVSRAPPLLDYRAGGAAGPLVNWLRAQMAAIETGAAPPEDDPCAMMSLHRIDTPNMPACGYLGLRLAPSARSGEATESDTIRALVRDASLAIGNILERSRDISLLERDYSAQLRRSRHLTKLAEQDGLTGLLGHQAFRAKAMDRMVQAPVTQALMMFDVDNFKLVNDIYGHQFGDHYLQEIARALERALPDAPLIGRIGGDEFGALVMLDGRDRPALDALMTRCADEVIGIAPPLMQSGLGHLSIGAARSPEGRADFDTLLLQADAALYAHKTSGDGAGVIYAAAQHANHSALLVRPRFERALLHDEIEAHFQPVIALDTGTRLGFELLARWRDPQRGLLAPGQFSSVLAAPELAEQLTRHLFDRAFAQLAARKDLDRMTLAVNLGTADLIRRDFLPEMQARLDRFGMDWARLVIEVTETTMMGAVSGPVFQALTRLRERGARVALDDFGTGYAGLMHLRHWPVDILKIDRDYIAQAARSGRDAVFTKALIDIACTLGLDTIGEGVENAETAALLRDQGCRAAQGYHFARPAPLDTF